MKRNVTIWTLMLFVMALGFSHGQTFTEDFEDGDISDWHQFRLDEEMIQAIDMSSAPAELLEGGDKVGYIQDADASYSGAAILLTGDTLDADYTVEANVYVYENHPQGSAYTGLVAYGDSSHQGPNSHGYYVKLVADFDSDNRFRLYNNQFSGFSYSWSNSISAADVDKSQGWHYMKIEVSTNWADSTVSYHCWYDETDLGTYVDDSDRHTYRGQAGVFSFHMMTTDGLAGYFDNFVVTPAGGTSVDDIETRPVTMTLEQNFPNPFNPSTTISFDIHESGNVALQIFNIKGERISTLVKGNIQPGSYRLIWDGTDSQGQVVAAGAYLVVLSRGNEQLSRSMLMIK